MKRKDRDARQGATFRASYLGRRASRRREADVVLVLVASRRLESSDREATPRLFLSRTRDMQGASETARQIVEFEELVSRLDRISDVVRPSSPTTSTSVPPPPPPPPPPAVFGPASLPYTRPLDAGYDSGIGRFQNEQRLQEQREQERQRQEQRRQEQQRVRVHIGIDEDLRMILEMDPSIVDRTPAPVILPNNHATFARPLRATRPQGWYWTARD